MQLYNEHLTLPVHDPLEHHICTVGNDNLSIRNARDCFALSLKSYPFPDTNAKYSRVIQNDYFDTKKNISQNMY